MAHIIQSKDGKYLIMGNGTRAFAIAAEPPEKANPLKTIEDIVEQNDNNFDGLINNTPQTSIVAELQQKAKAGEPISLIDYTNAIKTEKDSKNKKTQFGGMSMIKLTVEETNLLSIYHEGDKAQLIENMTAALPYMDADMREVAKRTLSKVDALADEEYAELPLYAADEA